MSPRAAGGVPSDGTGAGEQLRGQLKAMPERRTQIPNLELTAFCTWTEKCRFADPERIAPTIRPLSLDHFRSQTHA